MSTTTHVGGEGETDAQMRADIRLTNRALKAGWFITATQRAKAIERVEAVLDDDMQTAYVHLAAARTYVMMDSIDARRERNAIGQQQGAQHVALAALRVAISASPETARQLAALSIAPIAASLVVPSACVELDAIPEKCQPVFPDTSPPDPSVPHGP